MKSCSRTWERSRTHARQMYRWLYRRGITDFGQMTDLSVPLRQRLEAMAVVQGPTLAERLRSTDGTEKFLIAMHDGRHVESVFIPDTPRQTLCISTQVGCAMHCAFCLTGKMGLLRNLSAGEIVGQVRLLAHAIGLVGSRFNIVLMGMGGTTSQLRCHDEGTAHADGQDGFAVEPGWITLSTIGVPHASNDCPRNLWFPNLAVSLHAATEELRAELVPVNHKYKLADVVEACRQFPVGRRRRITFEYTLLDGVNDSADDAVGLARLLAGFQSKAKVNVIPLNEAPGIPYRRPRMTGRPVRPQAVAPWGHGVGEEEPRTRHSRGVRTAHRGGRRVDRAGAEIGGSAPRPEQNGRNAQDPTNSPVRGSPDDVIRTRTRWLSGRAGGSPL